MTSSDPQRRRFGRFCVTRALGAGGMGEVLLARDELLGRDVAIKTLRPMGLEGAAGEVFRARFLNEARAIASLSHPNVVRVHDLGFEGETPYLVMEVVPGPSLGDRLERGERLDGDRTRALAVQIGRALEAAHANGIVHRDVKPANVLEAEPGLWKLADFGVARVPDSSLTVTGQFLGSPAYSPPEALAAGCFGPPTDIYGLGATLYAALAGEPPQGDPARAGEKTPIMKVCPGVPADVAHVIGWALSPNPLERPSAAAFVAALVEASSATPSASRATAADSVASPARSTGATRAESPRALVSAPVPATNERTQFASTLSLRDPAARRRVLWISACVGLAMLLVGLLIGVTLSRRSHDDAPLPSPTAVGTDLPTVKRPSLPPAEAARSHKQRKKWSKIQDKVEEGKVSHARKDLKKYIREYPEDKEAVQLYEKLRTQPNED